MPIYDSKSGRALVGTPTLLVGTTLPTTCAPGDTFIKTDESIGQMFYYSKAIGVWEQVAGGGAGTVSSVFGRTGVITAQSGDYSFSQISGSIEGGTF